MPPQAVRQAPLDLRQLRLHGGVQPPASGVQDHGAAFERGISGTPTIYVNGKELKNDAFASEQAFKDAITNPQQ